MYPMAGELAYLGYRKYIRPRLKRAWDYKATAAPLILSQKINKMPPTTPRKLLQFSPKKKVKLLDTPGGSKMRVKRTSSTYGVSAGKIRKVKKIKRRYRKKMRKYVFNGVEKTTEAFKNEGTTGQAITFAHGTFVRDQVLEMAWKAVVKKFFEQQKVYINDWNDVATPYNAADWRFVISFINNGVGNSIALAMTTLTKYVDIIFWLGDTARPWNNHGLNIELDTMQITSNVTFEYRPFALLNLRRTKIHFEIKSSMKMQNRTINSTGNNESDDVDNVPLVGKIYQFKGTGLVRPKTTGDSQVYINDSTGYITPIEFGNYREPIDGLYYDKIKRQGKIKLEPGQIKTSVLTQKGTMFFSTLLNRCVEKFNNSNPKLEYGKCRAFTLEKMIDTLADNAPLGIALGLEVNNRFRFSASLMPTYVQTPEFVRGAL